MAQVDVGSALGDIDLAVDEVAFSGVIRVDVGGSTVFVRASGLANRPFDVANTVDTRFGLASGTKGCTALVVLGLVGDGVLMLDTTARSILGTDLPLVDERVTVGHLLSHRSGIGDYFDEDLFESDDDYVLTVPVHRLTTTESYLPALAGIPQRDTPGAVFRYNNGGFVVLALLAERATGVSFAELVRQRVTDPAGMVDTAFLRSDEPGHRTATGYLSADGLRTNALHLPVVGSGDGGVFSTVADLARFWTALFAGRIVPLDTVTMMTTPTDWVTETFAYGTGCWLRPQIGVVELHGYDAGVSCNTMHDPQRAITATILSNTATGADDMVPVVRRCFDR